MLVPLPPPPPRRGYAGELAPPAALDALSNEGDAVLIDIRTAKEKEGSGIPDLPSGLSSKALEVEYAVTEDRKLRGQLRDPSGIEAQVTALQVRAGGRRMRSSALASGGLGEVPG